MDYIKIGENIWKYRKLNGFSQEQLAEKINISVTHMSHIENGSTKLSLPVLVDFSEIFHVTVDELIFGKINCEDDIFLKEISLILKDCTTNEAKFLIDVIKHTKYSMDRYLQNNS